MTLWTHSRKRLVAATFALLTGIAHGAPGGLDVRFGDDGVLFVDRGGSNERIEALLAEPGGAALAGGWLNVPSQGNGNGYDMTVLRLLADGSLDPAFGDGGVLQTGLAGDSEYITAMARQPDGKVVAVGALEPGAYTDFGVIRFDAGGVLDTGFGADDPLHPGQRLGMTAISMGPTAATNDVARAVALQSDGRIVVAGLGFATEGRFVYGRFALTRLTADGQLDTSFGTAGRIIAPAIQAETSEYLTGIALRRDGSLADDDAIIVVGYAFARNAAIVRRYTSDGQPDPLFGNGGRVVLSDGVANGARTGLSRIDDAVLLEDGRIVLLGTGNDRGFAFVRLNPDGSVDHGFGSNGRTNVKFSGSTDYDEPSALRLQPNGKLVAVGYATGRYGNVSGKDFASVRLTADGRPDPAYGDGAGRSTFPLVNGTDVAYAVAVMGDGSLLIAGEADVLDGAGADHDAAFLRLQGDPGFFQNGFEGD